MESRIYMAQEMSDVSQRMKESGFDGEIILTVKQSDGSYKEYHGDDIIEMLRQASEMRERAEEVRSRHSLYYGKIDYEHETAIVNEVDYILRGDAGKESK